MEAKLALRFPTTVVEDVLVSCPALRLTGPEAKALRFSSLSCEIAGSPRVLPSVHLNPPMAAAVSLLWQDSVKAVSRASFLDYAFSSLRTLESFGASWCTMVLELHSELHPEGESAVAFGAPSASATASAPTSASASASASAVAPQHPATSEATAGGGGSALARQPSPRKEAPAVSTNGLWSVAAHKAFEGALRTVFHCPSPPPITDTRAWEMVASLVALPGVTALACTTHFASLALLVRQWSQEHGINQQLAPKPAAAAPPTAAAAAAAATAGTASQAPSVGAASAGGSTKASRGGAFLELLLQSTAPSESSSAPLEAEEAPLGSRQRREKGEGGEEKEGEGEDDDEEDEEDDDEEEDDYYEEEEHGIVSVVLRRPMLHGIFLSPPPLSTVSFLVELKGLHLAGVGALVCSLVHLGVTCSRCGTLAHMPLPGAHLARSGCCAVVDAEGTSAPSAGGGGGGSSSSSPEPPAEASPAEIKHWCTKCSNLLSCRLRAGLVHEGSPSLGYVVAENCTVAVASCAELWASCLECGEPLCVERFTAPGGHESSCQRCHARLRLECKEWEVEVREGGKAPPAPLASVRPGHTKYPCGRPLPERGTCAHFKKSRRWLRFPCCGLAYPCPVCHDEAASHPHERANRMLCGLCSREQPFTNAPCVACGEALTGRASSSSHWEGGEGQRVQALLSSKDKRKYTGMTKTKSAKATRVGTFKAKALAAAAKGREKTERPGQ